MSMSSIGIIIKQATSSVKLSRKVYLIKYAINNHTDIKNRIVNNVITGISVRVNVVICDTVYIFLFDNIGEQPLEVCC